MKEQTVYCVTYQSNPRSNGLLCWGQPSVRLPTTDAAALRGEVLDAQNAFPGCVVAVWKRGTASYAVLLCAFDAQGEVDYAALSDPSSYNREARNLAGRTLHDYEDSEEEYDPSGMRNCGQV